MQNRNIAWCLLYLQTFCQFSLATYFNRTKSQGISVTKLSDMFNYGISVTIISCMTFPWIKCSWMTHFLLISFIINAIQLMWSCWSLWFMECRCIAWCSFHWLLIVVCRWCTKWKREWGDIETMSIDCLTFWSCWYQRHARQTSLRYTGLKCNKINALLLVDRKIEFMEELI